MWGQQGGQQGGWQEGQQVQESPRSRSYKADKHCMDHGLCYRHQWSTFYTCVNVCIWRSHSQTHSMAQVSQDKVIQVISCQLPKDAYTILYSPLGMPKALKIGSQGCGEHQGQQGGGEVHDCRKPIITVHMDYGSHHECQWSVCDTCIMYVHVGITCGVVTWLSKVSSIEPLATLWCSKPGITLLSVYRGLESVPMEVWGQWGVQQGQGEVQDHTQLIIATCGLWVTLQAAVGHMLYLCNLHI